MAKVSIEGLDAFFRDLNQKAENLDRAARTITVQSAAAVEGAAKRNFIGAHRRGMPHVGGNRPNVVTGQTRRSIITDPVRHSAPGMWETQVGPTVRWGRRLELGLPPTRAFPYLAPGVASTEALRRSIAITQWGRALA
ncbi:MAG: hypothetical protein EPO08_21035 [Rhodospirillaceae bacterium]|nr:MAG: hypothetical protein EPO08_21035 [Rhodospirillaceae bacterium]